MNNFSQNSVKIVLYGVVGSERTFKRVWDTSQQAKSVRQAIAQTGRFTEKGTLFLCLLFLSIILDKNSYQELLTRIASTACVPTQAPISPNSPERESGKICLQRAYPPDPLSTQKITKPSAGVLDFFTRMPHV